MYGWVDVWMIEGWIDGLVDLCVYGWVNRWMDVDE